MASGQDNRPTVDSVIKEIDQESIKFIAAGEKISDIEAAIRELVENSLDAGAENIEIRLSRFGVDTIEIHDDGSGIREENFSTLGNRYHTSKIGSFLKLEDSLDTFGFRGEALSCLCSIANVTITTKTKTSPTGTKLTFKKDGSSKAEHVARGNGTTVIVKNLFHTLPVRKRELETSAKRQYDRVTKLIFEHVLARPQIKFTLTKKVGVKMEKDFTHGGTSLEGSIITIYGVKVLESLMPIKQVGIKKIDQSEKISSSSTENMDQKSNLMNSSGPSSQAKGSRSSKRLSNDPIGTLVQDFETTVEPAWQDFIKRSRRSKFARERAEYLIHGYISRIGQGRHSADSQFIYVNKKPCDIPKISRLINEVYRTYSNTTQYPFYCLFIQVQAWAADFNVPKKRTVILQEESKLCDIIRESLEAMYLPSAPGMQKSCENALIPVKSLKTFTESPSHGTKRSLEPDSGDEVQVLGKRPTVGEGLEADVNEKEKIVTKAAETNEKLVESSACKIVESSSNEMREMQTYSTPTKPDDVIPGEKILGTNANLIAHTKSVDCDLSADLEMTCCDQSSQYFDPHSMGESSEDLALVLVESEQDSDEVRAGLGVVEKRASGFETALEFFHRQKSDQTNEDNSEEAMPEEHSKIPTPAANSQQEDDPDYSECRFEQLSSKTGENRLIARIEHLDDLGLALERERAHRRKVSDLKEFSFAIHPNFNTVAEQELKFNLNKSSFETMQVLGQFNRGFIIARMNKHVFIIDQHATDERFNYEDQLERSPLVKQPMVHPKPLYLNSIQENTVINHLDEFTKRGFEFTIDPSKQAGFRVLLKATSICKGQGMDEYLDKGDVEELINVIIDSPNLKSSYSLRKVRAVAASRACRKSVMIGDKLPWPKMETIVSRMATLENPWVCAHGRPTIRHLMDTDWMEY